VLIWHKASLLTVSAILEKKVGNKKHRETAQEKLQKPGTREETAAVNTWGQNQGLVLICHKSSMFTVSEILEKKIGIRSRDRESERAHRVHLGVVDNEERDLVNLGTKHGQASG
jgi:hypothetical protein